jgi:hypothetical protein
MWGSRALTFDRPIGKADERSPFDDSSQASLRARQPSAESNRPSGSKSFSYTPGKSRNLVRQRTLLTDHLNDVFDCHPR